MLTRCHLRRPPAGAGPSVGCSGRVNTVRARRRPAVSGFSGQSTRAAPGRSKSGPARVPAARTGGFARFRSPRCADGASMSAWTSRWNLSAASWSRPTTASRRARTPPRGSGRPASTCSTRPSPAASARASWCCSAARRAWARPPGCSRWPATSPAPAGRPWSSPSSTTSQTLLVRLVALEAGQLGGIVAPNVARIRQTLRGGRRPHRVAADRLADTEGGVEALEVVQEYSDRLLLHRSTGTAPASTTITAAIDAGQRGDRQVAAGGRRLPAEGARRRNARRVRADHRGRRGAQGPRPRPRRPDPRGRGLRQGGPGRRQADARRQHARLVGAGLRGRHRPAAEQQVRRRRPAPPRLQHGQRREVPELGGAHASRRTATAAPAVDLEFHKRFDQSRFETPAGRVVEQLVDERVFLE